MVASTPMVLTATNQKGGVGKTTTVFHLADAARRAGHKVLVIDADPQGNITDALPGDVPDGVAALADVLSAKTRLSLDQVITPTDWQGVDLVPTTGEGLADVSNELIITTAGREFKLQKALDTHLQAMGEEVYDLVLIDTPPVIDQLLVNALTASTHVLPVTHAELWALHGLVRLVENIRDVREAYNPQLTITGVLINQYEKTLNSALENKRDLVQSAEALGLRVFEPAIPKRAKIADTAKEQESLTSVSGEDAAQMVHLYDTCITRLFQEGR